MLASEFLLLSNAVEKGCWLMHIVAYLCWSFLPKRENVKNLFLSLFRSSCYILKNPYQHVEPGVGAGDALEGSFLVPQQPEHHMVHRQVAKGQLNEGGRAPVYNFISFNDLFLRLTESETSPQWPLISVC